MQRRPNHGRQVLCTNTVSNFQPHEQYDGLLPRLAVVGIERLSAQRQAGRRHLARAVFRKVPAPA
jgi:hypothetical protein